MRAANAASWAVPGVLAAWDLANSPAEKLAGSVGICALAFAAALPALVNLTDHWPSRTGFIGFALRAWEWLGKYSPYAGAALLGISHFLFKNQPGSTLVPSVLFLIGLLAFVEVAKWARYTSKFGENVGGGVDGAWAGALASRFVPLTTMAAGLSVTSLALAAGFVGTWSALALAVILIVVVVAMAKTAAKVS